MTAASQRRTSRASTLPVKIIGIDPGTMVTGWGVVEAVGSSLSHVAHGTIATAGAKGQGERLSRIYHGIQQVIESHRPDGVSLERVFFARNAQSALKLGQARGVALLAAAHSGMAVHEYAATEIKVAVVGYGHGRHFHKVAYKIGLVGKMRSTEESDRFKVRVAPMLAQLGPFPPV